MPNVVKPEHDSTHRSGRKHPERHYPEQKFVHPHRHEHATKRNWFPIERLIPQDAHSVMNYVGSLLSLSTLALAKHRHARMTAGVLGSAAAATALLTDYRISATKLIPVEAHEVLDYVYGAALVAAPFLLGYYRKEPLVSALQIGTGISILATSLLTQRTRPI